MTRTSEKPRPVCNLCKKRVVMSKGRTVHGFRVWGKLCTGCHKRNTRFAHRLFMKDKCERCGFIPEDFIQLEVHHIDGNHKNNVLSNLKTLCANCHRLESIAPIMI